MILNLLIWLGGTLVGFFIAHRKYMDYFVVFCFFVIGFVYNAFMYVGEVVIRCFQYLIGLSAEAGSAPCAGGLATFFQIANTVFPVDETLRFLAVLVVGVWLPIGLYRLVKSWLPAGFAGGS